MDTNHTPVAGTVTSQVTCPGATTGGTCTGRLVRGLVASVAGLVLASTAVTAVAAADLDPAGGAPSANAGWQ